MFKKRLFQCADSVQRMTVWPTRIHAGENLWIMRALQCKRMVQKNGDTWKLSTRWWGWSVCVCVCVSAELCWCPLAVSLGRRIPAVQHGAGGHPLFPQHSVHPLRVLADLHHQLGAVHREEPVRQLRSGDPGQILAEGERPAILLDFLFSFLH